MIFFTSPLLLQTQSNLWREQNKKIALVPTMGFLHEGHLALMKMARKQADIVIASIFVNPTQFGPNEDFSRYPRDEKGDLEKLEGVAVDAVFLPTAESMYPHGFQTKVSLNELSQGLCGASRPGHFDGVATVVLKLLLTAKPHFAIFGEKDYQQLAIIRQMAKDLNVDVEIIGAPIQRNDQGLALSSRNVYLSAEEQKQALVLSQAIQHLQKLVKAGEKKVELLLKAAHQIIQQAPDAVIDYLEIVDACTLKTLNVIDRPARFLLAVKIGKTRLIDNGEI